MSLGEVAAQLYGRMPAEFVAARIEQVRAANAAGDRELAADIAALRKPTVAAWAVNMLVRAAPDEVAALLKLGAELRTAQRELSGKQLRSLTARRRQVVDALVVRAGAVAAEHGQPVTEAVLRQVGTTLTAALADPEVADRVRTATLSAPASYSGFGPVGPDLTVVPESNASDDARGEHGEWKTLTKYASGNGPDDDETRRRAREAQELRAAEQQARSALEAAEDGARQAAEELRRSAERLAELRADLAAAEERHRFAQHSEHAARREVRSATTELERTRRRLK